MTCRHCGQPVRRCRRRKCAFYDCRGWTHTADQQHTCDTSEHDWRSAEPEPGQPPLTETPTAPPAREIAS